MTDRAHPPAGPYEIGSTTWPGLAKLAEEAGELVQILAKLVGASGRETYYDGTDLRARLIEECADVIAAVTFFTETNALGPAVDERAGEKLALFRRWHAEG
ncbi:hypothetical protein ACQP2P_18245 [Dactylosporangium sp. CA-139114]|uniref:hypothetical protein n=1 Tax=Dactylosporangium sp. CA-139114 TaxID=3239931 RepID=UPI003D951E60